MLFFHELEPGLYGLMGGAGSGKSTETKLLARRFGYHVIHADDFFIGDSEFRKDLLKKKQEAGIPSLIDACNQFNWWDWGALYREIENSMGRVTIVEGAILGPAYILNLFKKIFIVDERADIRLKRLLDRDGAKRSVSEICARFLITEYSEGIYYAAMDKETLDKTECVKYHRNILERKFLPIEV